MIYSKNRNPRSMECEARVTKSELQVDFGEVVGMRLFAGSVGFERSI